MKQQQRPFLETIYQVRTIEQMILYNKIEAVPASEQREVIDFIAAEYEREATDYPFDAPPFDANAAIWGAKTLYFAAQLLLYRDNKPAELRSIVPKFPNPVDAGAMLSADLCLRFLPQVVRELLAIDADDPLPAILNEHLQQFHYSAIGHDIDLGPVNWDVLQNKCLNQLLLDRVTIHSALRWLAIPEIKDGILANLGQFKNDYWKNIV